MAVRLTLGALLSLSRDSEAINAVVNHPAVRPFVGPVDLGPVDLSPLVDRPENLFPFSEFGGFMFGWTAPATREVHTFFLPEGRGEWAKAARSEAIEIAREAGTKVLWTRVPLDAPHVEHFARGGGMLPTGETIETFGAPYAVFSMELN